ncbi:MAG: hypothetical protein ACFE0Q_11545 [Anaerolineae bacterium]
MAIIWQSTGFWLMVCAVLLIMIAGCTMVSQRLATVSPSSTPHHSVNPTMHVATFRPVEPLYIDTLTARFQHNNTFDERSAAPPLRDDPNPNFSTLSVTIGTEPVSFRVDTPQCYSLANGNYSCLGLFWNDDTSTLGDTRLQLRFLDAEGTLLGQTSATLAQRLIPAGSSAPYHMQIAPALADAITAGRMHATISFTGPPAPELSRLAVSDARGALTDSGRYRLTVSIRNESGQAVRDIRLFATLDGIEWGIVGYSIQNVAGTLAAGEQRLFQFEMIPQALPERIEHTLYVEARTGD